MRAKQGLFQGAVWILGVMMTGCGGDAPETVSNPPAEDAGNMAPVADGARRNACALIDLKDIEAIVGQPLTMLHNIESDDETVCELSDSEQNLQVAMTVHWRGGSELAANEQVAMGMASKMLNDDEVNIEELTGSATVKGLADKAFYSDIMPSWVLRGDVMIQLIAPRLPGSKTKEVFLAAAKKALSRLPT